MIKLVAIANCDYCHNEHQCYVVKHAGWADTVDLPNKWVGPDGPGVPIYNGNSIFCSQKCKNKCINEYKLKQLLR